MASRKDDHIAVVADKKEDLSYRTTLSTSTSSFEALDPHDPQLNRLASEAFTGKYKLARAEIPRAKCHLL